METKITLTSLEFHPLSQQLIKRSMRMRSLLLQTLTKQQFSPFNDYSWYDMKEYLQWLTSHCLIKS